MVNFILSLLFSLLSLGILGYCVPSILGVLSGAIVGPIIGVVLLIVAFYLYKLSLGYADNVFSKVFVKFLVPVLAIFYLVNKVLALIGIVLVALPF